MVVAFAGMALSVALCARLERTDVSLTASIFALWLALAPLLSVERRGAAAQGCFALACTTPFAILAISSDRACGAPWSALLAQLAVGATWVVAVASARARSVAAAREERWLSVWLVLALAAPLLRVALTLGADGARWPALEFLSSASVLDWTARRLSTSAAVDPSAGEFWSSLVAPTVVVALGWRLAGAGSPRVEVAAGAADGT